MHIPASNPTLIRSEMNCSGGDLLMTYLHIEGTGRLVSDGSPYR